MMQRVPSFAGASFTLLHVLNVQSKDSLADGMEGGARLLAQAVGAMKLNPATVTTILRQGDTKQTVLAVADEINADLIVMGSRGVGRLRSILVNKRQPVCVSTVQAAHAAGGGTISMCATPIASWWRWTARPSATGPSTWPVTWPAGWPPWLCGWSTWAASAVAARWRNASLTRPVSAGGGTPGRVGRRSAQTPCRGLLRNLRRSPGAEAVSTAIAPLAAARAGGVAVATALVGW